MTKAALYMRFNSQAQRDFLYLTRKYFNQLNFRDNCNVMDIGCGPGDTTIHGLLPRLPKSTKAIIGIDISSQMIEFARKYHQIDDRISYEVMDIGTSQIPSDYHQKFDHVFSFYCLQIVPNIRKAMENIHSMLKKNGDIFFNLLYRVDLFNIYDCLLDNDKWKPYLSDYKNTKGVHHNTDAFKEHFRNILNEVGFKINVFDDERKVMIYNKNDFFGIMKAINYVNIPTHLEAEFILDQFQVMKNLDKVFLGDFSEEQVYYAYSLLTVQTSKI